MEINKLEQFIKTTKNDIEILENKLSNDRFTENAPKDLLEFKQNELKKFRTQLQSREFQLATKLLIIRTDKISINIIYFKIFFFGIIMAFLFMSMQMRDLDTRIDILEKNQIFLLNQIQIIPNPQISDIWGLPGNSNRDIHITDVKNDTIHFSHDKKQYDIGEGKMYVIDFIETFTFTGRCKDGCG